MAIRKRGFQITLPPWHCHCRGGLPVSEHRESKLKAGTVWARFEPKTGEATTQICAQFRAYAFASGAWIASFQDVPRRHGNLPQPSCNAEAPRGCAGVPFPPKRHEVPRLSGISESRVSRPDEWPWEIVDRQHRGPEGGRSK